MSFYERLGVPEGATAAEIKSAYRRLVKQFHPDSGASSDVDRFRKIQEAYETLANSDRRRAYDAARDRVDPGLPRPVSWTGGFEEPVSPFREVFPRRRTNAPVQFDLVLTREEAITGGRALLEIPRDQECARCRGRGLDFFGWCSTCGGDGWRRVHERFVFDIPRGAGYDTVVTGRGSNGSVVRARIRVR